jgi:DHA1 family tetracycline resistance protein-like MFS transporter
MKISRYVLFPIFLIIFIDNFGYSLLFNMLGPMLLKPEYGMMAASTSVHLKNAMLALTFGIFPLTQFFAAPMIGEFADIAGRKNAFYISLVGMIVGFLLSAWSVSLQSIWLLFLSRLITGIFAGNISICMASIADLSIDEKVRGKNFSMVTALFGISWIAAMILGGYIANPNLMGKSGPIFAFLFTSGLTFINLLLIVFMYKDTTIKEGVSKFAFGQGLINIKETLMLKSTRVYFLIYFLWSLGWVMAVQWFPAYAIEVFKVSVDDFTTWYIFMGITWVLGAFFAKHYLINRLSTLSTGILGFFAMTACLFMMQFMPIFSLFALFFILGSFFAVFAMSSSLNLISFSAERRVQGKIMGLSQSMQSSAFVLVSFIAFLVSLYTISILFYFAASISALGLILLIYKGVEKKRLS